MGTKKSLINPANRPQRSAVSERKATEYFKFLHQLKIKIRSARITAAITVNHQLIALYWEIGHEILGRQRKCGWGAKVIERLGGDLHRSFPEMKGFSTRNLKYMRAFACAWQDKSFVQQAAAQIPWFHNCILLDKVSQRIEREWYIRETIKNGWSRNTLLHKIECNSYKRQGKALSNFEQALTSAQSDLTRETIKDPYMFDFLGLSSEARERDIEKALLTHLRDFMLELGVGFAFVGNQYSLAVGGENFYVDLLFYHLKLRCYVAIELKVGEFKPEHVGKMNLYLSVIDNKLRQTGDNSSVGIILCKSRNKVVAEYSLRDVHKPIGISSYKLTKTLPTGLRGNLPTITDLEAELQ